MRRHQDLQQVWRKSRSGMDMHSSPTGQRSEYQRLAVCSRIGWITSKPERGECTNRKNTPDDEVVVLLQAGVVPLGKRLGEFDVRIALSSVKRLMRERETAEEPHEAFCRDFFLFGLLIEREELERARLVRLGEVPGADFL